MLLLFFLNCDIYIEIDVMVKLLPRLLVYNLSVSLNFFSEGYDITIIIISLKSVLENKKY